MNDSTNKSHLLGQLRIDRESGDARPRASWVISGIMVGGLIAGAALWWWWGSNAAIAVEVATAAAPSSQGSGATAVLQATGYVTARRQATVSAQITGTLTEVLIEEGEHVQAGQVLARLESTAQRAQVAEAEAQLTQARATVGQVDSELEQARRDYTRQQELVARQLVSPQAAESARTQVESLVAQMAAQQGGVQLAQAQVRSARVQLDYTTVRAPFAGVVIAKAAQVGEIVSPLSAGGGFTRTGIGTIVDMDSLEIEVDVNEAYINRVQPGGPAEAVLDAYPEWTIPAHVIAIIPTADRGKATVKVRVALEQKDPRVLPDMGVRVTFLAQDAQETTASTPIAAAGVLVPASAIVQRDGKSVVFLIEGDHVQMRAVTPGQRLGDLTLVDGVPAGARLVRTPTDDMTDGARIKENS